MRDVDPWFMRKLYRQNQLQNVCKDGVKRDLNDDLIERDCDKFDWGYEHALENAWVCSCVHDVQDRNEIVGRWSLLYQSDCLRKVLTCLSSCERFVRMDEFWRKTDCDIKNPDVWHLQMDFMLEKLSIVMTWYDIECEINVKWDIYIYFSVE